LFRIIKIIPKIKYEFLIFTILKLFFGHFGIIFGYLLNKNKIQLGSYTINIFANGVLYNMGITLIASAIYPIIISLIENRTKFRGYRLLGITITFVFLGFLNCTNNGNLKMYHFLHCSCRRLPVSSYDRGYLHDKQGGYIGYHQPEKARFF
jgi:hypothetical protein